MNLFIRPSLTRSMHCAHEWEVTRLTRVRFVSKEIRDVLKKEPKMQVLPSPIGS